MKFVKLTIYNILITKWMSLLHRSCAAISISVNRRNTFFKERSPYFFWMNDIPYRNKIHRDWKWLNKNRVQRFVSLLRHYIKMFILLLTIHFFYYYTITIKNITYNPIELQLKPFMQIKYKTFFFFSHSARTLRV